MTYQLVLDIDEQATVLGFPDPVGVAVRISEIRDRESAPRTSARIIPTESIGRFGDRTPVEVQIGTFVKEFLEAGKQQGRSAAILSGAAERFGTFNIDASDPY